MTRNFLIPIVTNETTKRHKVHEEILTIVSKLIFLKFNGKGSIKKESMQIWPFVVSFVTIGISWKVSRNLIKVGVSIIGLSTKIRK